MKNEQEIKEKIKNYVKLLDDEENQNEIMQAKIWSAIDILKWVLQ